MITLYQFRHSAFCLKTRMALHAKKLQYRVEEVTPGLGQFEIFKISGQKQVPIIVDDNVQIISDSSIICEYINKKNDNNPLFPEDPMLFAQCKLIEDWADTTMASTCRKALIKSAIENPQLRTALLPDEIPSSVKKIVDIKCPSSNMNHKNLWSIIDELSPHDEIKFVIGDKADYEWTLKKINQYNLDSKWTILFSPVFDKLKLDQLANWILEDNLNVRLQLQMHKYIWDPDMRAV